MSDPIDVADLLNEEEEEEEEVMTAPEVLQKLEEAWLNEKFCPDVLPVKWNLVECMLAQLDAMEENISRAKKGDFRISVHRMEVDRIRFVVSSYLRLRLAKIESFTSHVLEEEEKRRDTDAPLLSPAELNFAREYKSGVSSHLTNLALKLMPPNVATMSASETVVRPNVESYVFLRVGETVNDVLVEEETADVGEEIMDFEKGDQHVLRYRPVASLVESGAVTLM